MRDFILILFSAFFASVFTYVIADRTASAQAHRVTIVADEQAGAVRIVIDGKEVAQFTAGGLAVRDDIEFGGVFTDVGRENFGKQATSGE